MKQDRQFKPLTIAVLVVSDSRTDTTDVSGKTLSERLRASGHFLAEKWLRFHVGY